MRAAVSEIMMTGQPADCILSNGEKSSVIIMNLTSNRDLVHS